MEIIVKKKSVEINLILDILAGYQNKERLKIEFDKIGIEVPKECSKIYKDIDKFDNKFKAMVKYYFEIETDELDRIYYLLVFLTFNLSFYDLEFEEYINNLKKINKKDILRNILAVIMLIEDDTVNYKDALEVIDKNYFINEEMVMKKLDKSKLAYSLKWKVYKIINDYEKGIDDLIYILKEFKKIDSKSYNKLKYISYNWADEVKDIFDKKGLEYIAYLDKSIDLVNIKKIYISPISAWRSHNFEGRRLNQEEFEISIGYNIEKTLDRFRRGKSEEWFKDVLKLLADPTRYKILKLLSKRDMYSGELAVETGMSQGTISHHMSNLVLYDLVEDFRKDGRVYYRLNKEKFKLWIEMLRKTL